MTNRPLRAMWLLNHTTARKFEIPMLKRIGVEEIFLPKKIPSDPAFRSASVDYSEDAHLTIPRDELTVLNAVDWYDDPGIEAWQIADKHFDLAFFIILNANLLRSISRHFAGAKIWRAYGMPKDMTYAKILDLLSHKDRRTWQVATLKNFWFGQAYSHLADQEPRFLQKNAVFLPAGLPNTLSEDKWNGQDNRIFLVCPDLAFSAYYQNVYQSFKETFDGLPYIVGGAQPVPVKDPHVLGYLPAEQHSRNMRELRVMFYHSTEPNHIHYHPFEAVRSGMPLVFMAESLLDRLGGIGLPGRCKTLKEARQKIERILANDWRFIDEIRKSQQRLLEPMKAENCEADWRAGLQRIVGQLKETASSGSSTNNRTKRVAVIMPVEYRGASLRAAKSLALAVAMGARAHRNDVELVFGHPDSTTYNQEEFEDLPDFIKRRPYSWRIMAPEEASRACAYAGLSGTLVPQTYMAPDDGINHFVDCDLWIIISDRLSFPLLPVRPYLLMIDDDLQRYQDPLDDDTNQKCIDRIHAAEAVMVTTTFSAGEACQSAGIPVKKIKKVPMLVPEFSRSENYHLAKITAPRFFFWTTNLGPHKNHENALKALRLYYEKYAGTLECRVTGVDTRDMFKRDVLHLRMLKEIRRSSPTLKQHLKIEGELSDQSYRAHLGRAVFLWHPAQMDHGTFSVIEAAYLGVPSLSSDYPAMREIDQRFSLNLTWMDPDDPDNMARQLKRMEDDTEVPRSRLPSAEQFAGHSAENLGSDYWNVVREFL